MSAMRVYAGIDEAGYGPSLGPMVVGRCVLRVPAEGPPTPDLWQAMSPAVCRGIAGRKWRIPIDDSKKLTGRSAGLKYLELGCLTFAHLADRRIASVGQWLAMLGAEVSGLPWYAPTPDAPWQALPADHTVGQIAVAANMLADAAARARVCVAGLGAAVVCEDQFNELVQRTRNKANVSFACVTRHIDALWRDAGRDNDAELVVCVDRQGGRMRYREPLQLSFPEARMTVLEETEVCSIYRMTRGGTTVEVRFEVGAERRHLPVALASMVSKFTRELLMQRFNGWWCGQVADLKPTAGYAADAGRWLAQVRDRLESLGVAERTLVRRA